MARGDHVRVKRLGYWHHGIDCGDGTVIHYAGEPLSRGGGMVMRTDLETFARGGEIRVVRYDKSADPDTVMRRAESRLAENGYDVIANNCEHFARWCKTGLHESRQVRRFLRAARTACVAAGVLLVGAAVPMVARRIRRGVSGGTHGSQR